ncbi:MAG: hypothetical protein EP341_03135 [Sphingomonadales bacterium]|nr:MAG: hypothetical protein EP341_03135 [Sphingomonadales bacterium]
MTDNTDAMIARQQELDVIAAAEQALQNSAVCRYFDEVEERAISQLLECDVLNDELRLKLTIIAQTMRKLRSYLRETADMRQFVETEIEALKEQSNG